ncbi:MAG: NADPH-dependent F420 reductase [Methanosphaera sp. rholeuAM270]|nr:MAG: NADPH-dependent F420 reductase [Methanosphaera sp. rholeuAM270]
MKIAIIGGTGSQGLNLGKRLAIAGEDVIIGSRQEEKALTKVEETLDLLKEYENISMTGMSNEDAAKEGELLILTVPLAAQKATLKSIKDYVGEKILIDATVPLETAIGGSPARFIDLMEGSAAERTAKILKKTGVKVVAGFNNISNSLLENIPEPIDCDCLIAGDDNDAKAQVKELVEKIPGINCIDCGKLEKARMIEKITPLLIGLNIKYKSHYGGLRITGINYE